MGRDDLFQDDLATKKPEEIQEGEFFFDLDDQELADLESQGANSDEENPPVGDSGPAGSRTDPAADLLADADRGALKKEGRARQRLLMFLLLVVLLGAGFFYLGESLIVPQSKVPGPVVKSQPQKIKVPVRTEARPEEPPVKEVVMEGDIVHGSPSETSPGAGSGALPETNSGDGKSTETRQSASSVADGERQDMDGAEGQTPGPEGDKPVSEAPPATSVPAAASAAYTLQIGAYVLEANLNQALAVIKSLGYQPKIIEGEKTVTMTRLKVGTFPEPEARVKLRELRELVPSPFLLREGDQLAVYAGSYYVLNRARAQADQLYLRQIRAEEETVDVNVPIKTIRFGTFEDSEAAARAAKQAAEVGLEALIVKQE